MEEFPYMKNEINDNDINSSNAFLNLKRIIDDQDISKIFSEPKNALLDDDIIGNISLYSNKFNTKTTEKFILDSIQKDSLSSLIADISTNSESSNNENKNEESLNIDDIIIELKEEKNLLVKNDDKKLNNKNIKLISEHNNDSRKISEDKIPKKHFEENLCCQALELLNKKGKFQIKISNDNFYILKIKEKEIKDHYFDNIDYAKKHGKNSALKNTAPNYKFWLQRFYYFSKFDQGILMDKESWYSVTPEDMAKYIAKLVKGKSIIDGFCGCGGNVIQFSRYCSKVYAIDISKEKLNMCKNNCKVYKCKDNIEFIESDFLKMKNKIKADYIFLSPPWGGTEYKESRVYSIKKYMYPDITEIVRVSLNVADNILFFLPRSLDLDELFGICSDVKNEIKEKSGKQLFFDIQILKSNDRIKSLLIIFGQNVNEVFRKRNLESFLKKYYKNIKEKDIDTLFSIIKSIDCFKFFKEENEYRITNLKGDGLIYLVDYMKERYSGEGLK